jgi:hypothetical protein
MEYDGIVIKPYTPQELATRYEVSRPTLRRWLKPHLPVIGARNGHFYTSKQVEIIFNTIGWPPPKGTVKWREVA